MEGHATVHRHTGTVKLRMEAKHDTTENLHARNNPAEQMEAARPGNSRTYQGFVLFVRGSRKPKGQIKPGIDLTLGGRICLKSSRCLPLKGCAGAPQHPSKAQMNSLFMHSGRDEVTHPAGASPGYATFLLLMEAAQKKKASCSIYVKVWHKCRCQKKKQSEY